TPPPITAPIGPGMTTPPRPTTHTISAPTPEPEPTATEAFGFLLTTPARAAESPTAAVCLLLISPPFGRGRRARHALSYRTGGTRLLSPGRAVAGRDALRRVSRFSARVAQPNSTALRQRRSHDQHRRGQGTHQGGRRRAVGRREAQARGQGRQGLGQGEGRPEPVDRVSNTPGAARRRRGAAEAYPDVLDDPGRLRPEQHLAAEVQCAGREDPCAALVLVVGHLRG